MTFSLSSTSCLLKLPIYFTSTSESIGLQRKSRAAKTFKAAQSVVTKFLTVSFVHFTFIDICEENEDGGTDLVKSCSVSFYPRFKGVASHLKSYESSYMLENHFTEAKLGGEILGLRCKHAKGLLQMTGQLFHKTLNVYCFTIGQTQCVHVVVSFYPLFNLNSIFFCLKLIIIHYHTQEQRQLKFKPKIKN